MQYIHCMHESYWIEQAVWAIELVLLVSWSMAANFLLTVFGHLQVLVMSWSITATFSLFLVYVPVSVGMWYAGDAARVFFQQVKVFVTHDQYPMNPSAPCSMCAMTYKPLPFHGWTTLLQ